METKTIFRRIASEVAKKGIHVIYTESCSSNSIYVLFDYGLIGQLRISDHDQDRYVFKYNLNVTKAMREKEAVVHPIYKGISYFYGFNLVDELIEDIFKKKENFVSNNEIENYDKARKVQKMAFREKQKEFGEFYWKDQKDFVYIEPKPIFSMKDQTKRKQKAKKIAKQERMLPSDDIIKFAYLLTPDITAVGQRFGVKNEIIRRRLKEIGVI